MPLLKRLPDPDDPLAVATGCLNAIIVSACLAGAVFLIVLLVTR